MVYAHELSTAMEQRKRLIPTIARILADSVSLDSDSKNSHDRHVNRQQSNSACFEESLRSSLTRALDWDSGQAGVEIPINCETRNSARQVAREDNRGWYPPEQQQHDEGSVESHLRPRLAAPMPCNPDSIVDPGGPCQVSVIHPQGEAAGQAAVVAISNPFEALYQTFTNADRVINVPESEAYLASSITHASPNRVVGLKIDDSPPTIGSMGLTHGAHLTFPTLAYQNLEDILIAADSRVLRPSSRSNTNIEIPSSDEGIPQSSGSQHTRTILKSAARLTNINFYQQQNTMASRDNQQSLSEVLGDDQFLWSMWKRRASTCPPGEDEAEQLHDMFVNDPDMKVFSPTRGGEDDMMFDSYDFSRKSTNSSQSSSSSYSRTSFEQLERPGPYSYSGQTPSGSRSTLSSTKDSKQDRRRSSGSKKSSKSSRMSENDILFQQTSSSRSIDIKSRKSLR